MKNFMSVEGLTPPKKSSYCGIFATTVWHSFDSLFVRVALPLRSQPMSKAATQSPGERVFPKGSVLGTVYFA